MSNQGTTRSRIARLYLPDGTLYAIVLCFGDIPLWWIEMGEK